MISKLNSDMISDLTTTLMDTLKYVSLHEYPPYDNRPDGEIKSSGYKRKPVYWYVSGAGQFANNQEIRFEELEDPTVIVALGLHRAVDAGTVDAWGVLNTHIRVVGKTLIIPRSTIVVRIG